VQSPSDINPQNQTITAHGSVSIPKTNNLSINQTVKKPEETISPPTNAIPTIPTSPNLSPVNSPLSIAQQDTRLPIPFTPTTPNILVGMTLTPQGKILEGTLVEIRQGGITIRATKSNQLGQFLFAKPLDPGTIQIITEKSGYEFDTYALTLTNQIIKPLRLQAKTQIDK
jgi:hypothetical protein